MSIFRYGVVVGLGAVLLASCGNSEGGGASGNGGSGGGPAGDPIPLSDLGDAYETLLCRYFIECRGDAYLSVEECKEDREPSGLGDVEAAVTEGRVAYDPTAVGACRDAIANNLCNLFYLFPPSVPDILDDCLEEPGRQGAGQPCRHDLECTAGHFCSMQNYACPGICHAYQREGHVCAVGSETECAPAIEVTLTELFSLSPAEIEQLSRQYEPEALACVDGQCEKWVPLGGACKPGSKCQSDGFCEGGTCRPPIQEGEPCTFAQTPCAEGLFCDLPTPQQQAGTCRRTSSAGGPCTVSSDCDEGLECIRSDAGAAGQCSVPRAAGGPCITTTDCAEGLGCSNGTCGALPSAGSPCALGSACARGSTCEAGTCMQVVHPGSSCNAASVCLGRCVGGSCVGRSAVGEPCSSPSDCASRACEGDVCIDDELCVHRTGAT